MLKLFASIATLAAALALGTAAPAAASTPCWKVVVSDWYADGRIDKTYPLHCYQDALHHLPPDVKAYADASDEIERAMQAAIRDNREKLAARDQTASGHSKRDEQGAFASRRKFHNSITALCLLLPSPEIFRKLTTDCGVRQSSVVAVSGSNAVRHLMLPPFLPAVFPGRLGFRSIFGTRLYKYCSQAARSVHD